MSDDRDTGATDESRTESDAGGVGPSEVPEESVESESDLALDKVAEKVKPKNT